MAPRTTRGARSPTVEDAPEATPKPKRQSPALMTTERRAADQNVWMEIGKLQGTDKVHDGRLTALEVGITKLQLESTQHTAQLAHIDEKLDGVQEAVLFFKEEQRERLEDRKRIEGIKRAVNASVTKLGSGMALLFGIIFSGTLNRASSITFNEYLIVIAVMIVAFLANTVRLSIQESKTTPGGNP